MKFAYLTLAVSTSLVCGACSTTPTQQSSMATPPPVAATSKPSGADASQTSAGGEIVGTPAPNSKFAKLKIGMDMSEIQNIMDRAPDRSHSYESGKRWIPFYFGNDARRVQALYKGEGCLTVTGGNIWGGAGGDLIKIEVDPSGACYQP